MIRRPPTPAKRTRVRLTAGDTRLVLRALSQAHDREMRQDTRRQLERIHRKIRKAKP